MIYRVVLLQFAQDDLVQTYNWAAARAPSTAAAWLKGIQDNISTLERLPQRCPLARENRRSTRELREMLVGNRPHILRLIFYIAADEVRVLRIVRGQRRFLTRKQIDEAAHPDD